MGNTEGELSVSLSGGANYNIPIAVPPGINGVVPQVSLSYNSQGGNGLAGYGWNISGVSVITRIGRRRRTIIMQKKTRLAAALLAILLLVFVLVIHLPGVLAGGDSGQMSMMNLLKDLAIAGGALVYAGTQPVE